MYIEKLKEMFQKVTISRNAAVIQHYYHPEFLLYCNEKETDYAEFLSSHEGYYKTPIQYAIEYDEDTLVEQGEKIAARVWITTSRPNEEPTRIEVILIAQYKDGKIYRMWELTYPDWSKLAAFNESPA